MIKLILLSASLVICPGLTSEHEPLALEWPASSMGREHPGGPQPHPLRPSPSEPWPLGQTEGSSYGLIQVCSKKHVELIFLEPQGGNLGNIYFSSIRLNWVVKHEVIAWGGGGGVAS